MLMEKERNELVKYGKKLIEKGLTRGTGGNLSIFNREEGLMAITPSGIPYDSIKPEDIVLMNMSGEITDSTAKPSSEWAMHLELYKAKAHVNAMVHTHSTFATTLSCLREDLPAVDYLIALAGSKTVKCADYALYGTKELALNAIQAMGDSRACLLANHGLNVGAESLMIAMDVAEEVEFCSELYVRSKSIGNPVILTDDEMDQMLEKVKTYGQQKE